MVMTNSRYISPEADRYIQRSQERLMRLKKEREKQRRREMASSVIFISIGIVFAVSLFFVLINSGNLSMDSSTFSQSFEILLNR